MLKLWLLLHKGKVIYMNMLYRKYISDNTIVNYSLVMNFKFENCLRENIKLFYKNKIRNPR